MSGWITLATIVRPRGNRGEVIAEGNTADPDRFLRFKRLFILPGERPVEVEEAWEHRGRLVLKLRGIESIADAEQFRGARLCIPPEDQPQAAEGEFQLGDLIGCRIIEKQSGQELGAVTDWLEYGGPVLLEVKGGGKELLIPFAAAICLEIDVHGKRIVVDLPQGLKEL
ncbi:MAG: 16S rRNA processing protein RimM [Acidobacteria bacterium]|nr:16S rRNA processing protein RimM [Acidobacteriota bacterium]